MNADGTRPHIGLIRLTSGERAKIPVCPVQLCLEFYHYRHLGNQISLVTICPADAQKFLQIQWSASYVNPQCEVPTFSSCPPLLLNTSLPKWLPASLQPAWRKLAYPNIWGRSKSCSHLIKHEIKRGYPPSKSEGCLVALLVSRKNSVTTGTLQSSSAKDIRLNQLLHIRRPSRNTISMSNIPLQHAQKASTLPQTSQPPQRKPKKFKLFWRRQSQSPNPRDENIRTTVSSQSLEEVLSPRTRSAVLEDVVPPEKRKSSFGNFLAAFRKGDRSKRKKEGKKKVSRQTSADLRRAAEINGVPVTIVPSFTVQSSNETVACHRLELKTSSVIASPILSSSISSSKKQTTIRESNGLDISDLNQYLTGGNNERPLSLLSCLSQCSYLSQCRAMPGVSSLGREDSPSDVPSLDGVHPIHPNGVNINSEDNITNFSSSGRRISADHLPSVQSPPSYLGIACAVSGYRSINRYDSSVRDGFRSRDASPAPPRLSFGRSRDSSPHRERTLSPEAKATPQETVVRISQLKAQLAKCASDLTNQIDERSRQASIRRRDRKPPSGRSVSVDRGYLTKASEINTGASYRSPNNMTSHQLLDSKFNGHQYMSSVHQKAVEDTRSFIQERIERLYGPQALAAGFIKRTPNGEMGNSLRRNSGKQERIVPVQLEYGDEVDRSESSMPSVFRHLRPEFRHQLPVKSPSIETKSPPEVKIIPIVMDTDKSDFIQPENDREFSVQNGKVDKSKQNGCSSSVTKVGNNRVSPVSEVPVISNVPEKTNDNTISKTVEKDGHHFLEIVAEVVKRLESEAANLDSEMEKHTGEISEEVRGKFFACTGKTRLLISQKIKQFSGLCHKNITGEKTDDEFPTTCGDLAGFWDMVCLQVEDVENSIKEMKEIINNGWKEVEKTPVKPIKPSSSKPSSSLSSRRVKPVQSAASKERDEARKKAMEERRRAMRQAMKAKKAEANNEEGAVEIFTNDD